MTGTCAPCFSRLLPVLVPKPEPEEEDEMEDGVLVEEVPAAASRSGFVHYEGFLHS